MSVNEDGADPLEEIDIDDLSPEKISNIFSWSEGEEINLPEVSEGEKREPSFGSLARDDAPDPERGSVFERDDSMPEGRREEGPITPPSFANMGGGQKKPDRSSTRSLSFLGKIQQIRDKRKVKEKEAALGLDFSPPKKGEVLDPPTAFQELLQPLSKSELVLLQKDVQADETVYVRINKARSSSNTKQRWSIFLTSIVAVLYFLSLGPEYLTETLVNANNSWLPEALGKETRGQIVFAIGLLFPILSLFTLSEGFRLLLVFLSERRSPLAARALITLSLSALSLFFLASGAILLSGATLLSWWLFKKIISHPLLKKLSRRNK